MTKIQNLKLDGCIKSPIPVTPAKAGVQIHLERLGSAKASLRARLPDQVRHKLRRNDHKLTFYGLINYIFGKRL